MRLLRLGYAAFAALLLFMAWTALSPARRTAAASEGHGVKVAAMDTTCKPCDDFYKYANGKWTPANPIPAAYPSWGSFTQLAEKNRDTLHHILEDAAKNVSAPAGSPTRKIGDFYASCMDEPKIESAGVTPLIPEMSLIDKIADLAGLQSEIARLQARGVRVLFEFGSAQDRKDSTQVIGFAAQGGLGLPDRDYYTKTDDKSKQLRDQYVAHVAKMLALLGDDPARTDSEAAAVLQIENKLAEVSMTRVERRDPDATYHRMSSAELKTLTPDFSWTSYFHEIGTPGIAAVNVAQPEFFKKVDSYLSTIPLADWKVYLRWRLIDAAAPGLSSKFVEEDFNFGGRILQGTTEILPRWQRCVRATDQELGEALGEVYVQKAFSPEAKARAQQMVHNLIAALREDLNTLTWMGPETRKAAIAKLDAFAPKIGYPDKWRDYSAYRIDRRSYFQNVLEGNRFEFDRNLAQIGKPVDRAEWGMTPPTVNAYYNSSLNEIVFPAGILQPPFFDPLADDAANYGGIGAVIGHEMTHGFDDQGRKFDAQGNLKNWWTLDDLKNYTQRADCVEKQFDAYVVQGNLHENGKLVLGESIADLGGLTIAYNAFQISLRGKQHPATIDGLTAEQRFFVAWAQVWAQNNRPEYERLIINTNPHPLGPFRAIGAPSNIPAFAEAFSCHAGDMMVRGERCQIW